MAGSIATSGPYGSRDSDRARIVEAAADLMRAHGVASTSLDAVLAASKASKSQLYHYFADKDDLVLAVIQRQTECVLAAQESLLRGLTSLSGLRRWRDAVVEMSRKTMRRWLPAWITGLRAGRVAAAARATRRKLRALGSISRRGVQSDRARTGSEVGCRPGRPCHRRADRAARWSTARSDHALHAAS